MTLSVERPYDVTLRSGGTAVGLLLAEGKDGAKLWKKELAPGLVPVVQASGNVSYASLPPGQEIAADLSDLSGGFGAYDHEPGRYEYADGVDCSYAGVVLPGPQVEATAKNPAGALDGPVSCSVIHNGTLFTGAGQRVYAWDGANWIEKLNAGATVTDLGTYNGYLLCALGTAAGYQYSSDGGATWTVSTLADNRATFWAVVQDSDGAGSTLWKARLNYGIAPAGAGLLSSSNPSNGGGWSAPVYAGDGNEGFTSLRPGGAGRGLLIGKAQHLYRRSPEGTLTLVAGPFRPASGAGRPNFAQGMELSGRVYYPVEDYGVLEYDLGGGQYRVGFAPRDFGPSVSMAQAAVAALCTDGEWLYLALAGSAGYVFKGRYHEGKWVWHGAIAAAGAAVGWMTVADAAYRYLWLGPTASDYTPKRARLPRGNPLFDASALFRQLGHLRFGRYTGNMREVRKAARRLALQTENLGAGDRQIGVQWIADEGSEHAAVAVTGSPEGQVDFKFTADAVGAGLTVFNRLQLHLSLQSGTTPGAGYSVPAALRGAVLRSLLRPARRWRFEFTVRLADGAALVGGAADPAQTRSSVRALLESLARQAAPVQLEDREGVTRWVVIESYDEVELRDSPPGRLGRFESGARLAAIWAPDPVDAPE